MIENENQDNLENGNKESSNIGNGDNTQILDEEKLTTDNIKKPEINLGKPKEKKNKIFKTLLAGIFFFSCGFGGSYLSNYLSDSTVINKVKVVENTSEFTKTSTSSTSLQDTIENISPAVVEILSTEQEETNIFNQTYISQSAGSGVIISKDGYIVTNNHVVEGSTSVTVTLQDGTSQEAKVIGTDSRTDLAVLKIEGDNYPFANFADSDAIRVGDTAIAIGNPLGELGGSVTTGIVSAINREVTIDNTTYNLIQTNAEINKGNSGGGLFNDQGLLIGIVNAKNGGTNVEGIGFAIPSNQVENISSQLIQYGYVADRAALGIYIQEITNDTKVYPAGVYVTDFTEDSAARDAGIKQYDRIVSIDGEEVESFAKLAQILDNHSVKDTIEIVVSRSGEELTLSVKLQAYTQQLKQ